MFENINLILALSESASIDIWLKVGGSFFTLLLFLIGYIIRDWKTDMKNQFDVISTRLDKIDGAADPEKGRLAILEKAIGEMVRERERSALQIEQLGKTSTEFKSTVDEFKKEIASFFATATLTFVDKEACDHNSSHLEERMKEIRREWADVRKEDTKTIKELTNEFNLLKIELVKISTRAKRTGQQNHVG